MVRRKKYTTGQKTNEKENPKIKSSTFITRDKI